ncbi:ERAD-associated E3 ubiquitin-protein ligase component HRD3A [Babesia caballi]|uniref:ERAD-associated E3 ubiquitin-protein ligase component HRD3A n=1 Tax=Babesia caballi TaxID=5871 RepID=A0AAV4LQX9_BABCB|nr:ERAD-associated E3 ubiquitin-protein ligase component HRD3A [Babesia caballi]
MSRTSSPAKRAGRKKQGTATSASHPPADAPNEALTAKPKLTPESGPKQALPEMTDGGKAALPAAETKVAIPKSDARALVNFATWEEAVSATHANIAGGIEKYAVEAAEPLYTSVTPVVLDGAVKVADASSSAPAALAEPGQDAAPSQVYYQIPPTELIALAACAKNPVNLFCIPKKVMNTARRPRPEEGKGRISGGIEESRHQGHLISFESQLLPLNKPGIDQPLAFGTPLPKPPLPHAQGSNRIASGLFPMYKMHHGRESVMHRDGFPAPADRRSKHPDDHQLLLKQHMKARAGGGDKWAMPKATDGGIFSLGSIRGDTPNAEGLSSNGVGAFASRGNSSHPTPLQNISQMVQDLHLKKLSASRSTDVMNMSTQEVSNFKFIDDETHSPIKSSQFSQLFSAAGLAHKAETAKLAAEAEGRSGPSVNVADDARNRERATQLLQQMMARKA